MWKATDVVKYIIVILLGLFSDHSFYYNNEVGYNHVAITMCAHNLAVAAQGGLRCIVSPDLSLYSVFFHE